MSHADGNSTEGESASGRHPGQTGTGCYRNFDHFPNRPRHSSNSSNTPCLPISEGPPQPVSPSSQRRLLELAVSSSEEQQTPPLAPLAQDETQLLPYSPKGYISPSADSKKSDSLKRQNEKIDELPSEFECCFCTTKHYKDFVDAENLMPLPTSDFRNPVCFEMKRLKMEEENLNNMTAFGFPEVDTPKKVPISNNGELVSMDSSDTFASCTTHPFNSQGDLASDIVDPLCTLDNSNLYVNPLHKSGDNSPVTGVPPQVPPPPPRTTVKKSASGDTGLRSLGTSPMDEGFKGFGTLDRGSRVSLNESPTPKNRKTRFQQGGRPRTRFGEALERDSQESLDKRKKASFMPSRGLASATRILNHHLFGISNLGGSRSAKSSGSKSSLSVDSIDSRTSPQLELHRRSKSILKKADSGGSRNADPESERLISDNGSGFDIAVGESPSRRLSSPPARHRQRPQNSKSYQLELERTRTLKSQLFLLDDIVNKDKQLSDASKLKMSSDCVNEVPLYICPPPPPMDEGGFSPTEETRLLPPAMTAAVFKQPANSIPKEYNLPSS